MESEYCTQCGAPLEEWECGGICEGCATTQARFGGRFFPGVTFQRVKTMNDEQRIARAAVKIAGSIFEDCDESALRAKLIHCCTWQNQGTDDDLTQADRDGLRLLLDAAAGIRSNLCNSETGAVIRAATVEEVCESVLAGPEGHIIVGGVQCYVEL